MVFPPDFNDRPYTAEDPHRWLHDLRPSTSERQVKIVSLLKQGQWQSVCKPVTSEVFKQRNFILADYAQLYGLLFSLQDVSMNE